MGKNNGSSMDEEVTSGWVGQKVLLVLNLSYSYSSCDKGQAYSRL